MRPFDWHPPFIFGDGELRSLWRLEARARDPRSAGSAGALAGDRSAGGPFGHAEQAILHRQDDLETTHAMRGVFWVFL